MNCKAVVNFIGTEWIHSIPCYTEQCCRNSEMARYNHNESPVPCIWYSVFDEGMKARNEITVETATNKVFTEERRKKYERGIYQKSEYRINPNAVKDIMAVNTVIFHEDERTIQSTIIEQLQDIDHMDHVRRCMQKLLTYDGSIQNLDNLTSDVNKFMERIYRYVQSDSEIAAAAEQIISEVLGEEAVQTESVEKTKSEIKENKEEKVQMPADYPTLERIRDLLRHGVLSSDHLYYEGHSDTIATWLCGDRITYRKSKNERWKDYTLAEFAALFGGTLDDIMTKVYHKKTGKTLAQLFDELEKIDLSKMTPSLAELVNRRIEGGLVNGDELYYTGHSDNIGIIDSYGNIQYERKAISIEEFAALFGGTPDDTWTNIYHVKSGKTLAKLWEELVKTAPIQIKNHFTLTIER